MYQHPIDNRQTYNDYQYQSIIIRDYLTIHNSYAMNIYIIYTTFRLQKYR